MSKLKQRLLVFFIGGPITVSIAFLPYFDYLALYLVTSVFSFLCARELHTLFSKKLSVQPSWLFISACTIVPLSTYLIPLFGLSNNIIYNTVIITTLFCCAFEIFNTVHKENFEKVFTNIATTSFGILYLGLFPTFIIQVSYHEYATIFIAIFLILVILCDSSAWFFGMLFGKGNRGLIKVSPNKSIAGYIGGILSTMAMGAILYFIFNDALKNIYYVIITAFVVSICSILGDLFESALKRAGANKDSDVGGMGIPGRGGFLDSLDSMYFTAPIYFMLVSLFF